MKNMVILGAASLLAACGGETPDAQPSAAPNPAPAPAPEPEPISLEEQGRRMFPVCAVCHMVQPNLPSGVGPNLYNIYGQPAGQVANFNYSTALQESGIVWNEETLDAYLEDPLGYIPGNRMAYAGERNPERRAALIAYMKSLTPADAPDAE
ncbi:MAG: cytochrome c family protein [Pseudomonadota bacterium]